MAVLSSDYWKKQIMRHINFLEHLARKRFPDPNAADEAFLYTMKKLEENDWCRVRNFKGKASFTTYLSCVADRLLKDFSRHKFGRLHLPVWIKAKGALWVEVYRRLCLEQMPIIDVQQSLNDFVQKDRVPAIIDEAIEIILSKVTNCRKYSAEPVSTDPLDMDMHPSPDNLSPDELFEIFEHISIMKAVFISVTEKNRNIDNPNDKIGDLIQQFRSHINFKAKERLFLKTIYEGGQTVDDAGRLLGWNSNQSHSKLYRLKARIRKAMKKTGLERELRIILSGGQKN